MTDEISIKRITTPVGELVLGVSTRGCRLVEFADRIDRRGTLAGKRCKFRVSDEEHKLFERVEREIAGYFAGSVNDFSIPLDLQGTPFQVAVWEALLSIPFGETATYGEIAGRVGKPTAVRAVGGAVGRNPVSVVVPCHRVVRTGGGLGGYGGGLWRKEYLLDLERRQARAAAA